MQEQYDRPIDVEQYVETTTSRTCAGTSQFLRSQACKTSTFQNSYFVRIVNLWNYACKTAPSNSFDTLLLQNIPPQDLPPTYCHCIHS